MNRDAPVLDVDVKLRLGAMALDLVLATGAASLALVGPSGAGKSTVLRILAGLELRARGRVAALGETWQDSDRGTHVPPWRRGVGWVPQDAVLLPHRTVRENLAWGARPGTDIRDVAEKLEIAGLLDRPPRHLSGGERQRVALGRALLSDPRLLLLDEPFAAMDRALRSRLNAWLRAWCSQRDLPFLLVSHDDGDVSALASEVWHLAEGRGILSPLRT